MQDMIRNKFAKQQEWFLHKKKKLKRKTAYFSDRYVVFVSGNRQKHVPSGKECWGRETC